MSHFILHMSSTGYVKKYVEELLMTMIGVQGKVGLQFPRGSGDGVASSGHFYKCAIQHL